MLRQLSHPRAGAAIVHPAWVFLLKLPGVSYLHSHPIVLKTGGLPGHWWLGKPSQVKEPRASSLTGFWGSYLDFPKTLLRDTQKDFSSWKLNLQRMPTPATPSPPATLRADMCERNDNIKKFQLLGLLGWERHGGLTEDLAESKLSITHLFYSLSISGVKPCEWKWITNHCVPTM